MKCTCACCSTEYQDDMSHPELKVFDYAGRLYSTNGWCAVCTRVILDMLLEKGLIKPDVMPMRVK